MVFSEYTKRRILLHQAKSYCLPTIADKLRDEGIVVSMRGVNNFLSQVEETCSTARCPLYIHKLALFLYLMLTCFQCHSPGHLPYVVIWTLYLGTLYTQYTSVCTTSPWQFNFLEKSTCNTTCTSWIGKKHINQNGMERNNWNGREQKNSSVTEANRLQYFAHPFNTLAISVDFLMF